MTELFFRTDLYSAGAVAVAAEAFADHADIEHEQRDNVIAVRIVARDGANEADLSGEFSNYVLGATVDGLGNDTKDGAK